MSFKYQRQTLREETGQDVADEMLEGRKCIF